MKTEDLAYHGSDPGAVRFGNFMNYYTFHSTKQRIDNLHPDMFPSVTNKSIFCLDIGCNTGELSRELMIYLKTIYPDSNISMLAIDIDPVLISRAQEANNNSNITFAAVDIMANRQIVDEYLYTHRSKLFDITFCFSVTMWIHLNNGDEGLLQFLKYTKNVSRAIIIEPQPWYCYRNAQRRVKKSGSNFPLYESLKIRSNVDAIIDNILSEDSHKKLYESSSSSWNRKVQSYQQL